MIDTTEAVPVPNGRSLTRTWRLVAAAVCLGLLAATVPDHAASRWAAGAGLVLLALATVAVVLLRRKGRHVRTPADPVPSVQVAVAVAVAVLEPQPVPAVSEGDPVAVVHEDGPVEPLASIDDPFQVFLVENSGRAGRQPVPELAQPGAVLPSQRGAATPAADPARTVRPATSWVPLDDVVTPILQAGWPFVAHGGESVSSERSAGR